MRFFMLFITFIVFSVLGCSGGRSQIDDDLTIDEDPDFDQVDDTLETTDDEKIDEDSVPDEEDARVYDECISEEKGHEYKSFEVNRFGFILNGRYTLLRGGTIQYFRLPQEEWENRLVSFKKAGFNTVDIYVAWNIHEPQEGVFNFEDPNLSKFLELIKKHGLFAYFRPGPYICNEFKNGGIPSWLIPFTTKKSKNDDGLVNLRTDDPDFLIYVERYFSKLNEVIKPFLITNGGPIILYSLENEFNYGEMFFDIDKLFWYEGGPERGLTQSVGTKEYFSAMKKFARNDGIDIPLTTCPGLPEVKGMGDVPDIIPMPNFYDTEGLEKAAYDLLRNMHNTTKHGGIYSDFPSATTESNRLPSQMMRLFAGGLDGFFGFNIAGMHNEGYNNTIIPDPGGLDKIVDISVDSIRTAFINPTVGYFSNVVDYYGPISPAGMRREKFFNFRRVNMMLNLFEEEIASELYPFRASAGINDSNERLEIYNSYIGAKEDIGQVHYWFTSKKGTNFIFLTNETGKNIHITKGQIKIDDLSIPKYTSSMIVPVDLFPGKISEGDSEVNSRNHKSELYNTHLLVTNAQITEDVTLSYTTSQILTLKTIGCTELLVLFGHKESSGEISLEIEGEYEILHYDENVVEELESENTIDFSYTHKDPSMIVLKLEDGKIFRILITTYESAGKIWFNENIDPPFAVSGFYDFEYDSESSRFRYMTDLSLREFYTVSNYPLPFENIKVKKPFNENTGITVYELSKTDTPELSDELISKGKILPDLEETHLEFSDDEWISWSGRPQYLDFDGIHEGHAWYRTKFELPQDINPSEANLYIEHASDIVGIYINGNYLTTVCPLGTEINSQGGGKYGFDQFASHLLPGSNIIAFRTEIWGHGSFMWPRGKLAGLGQMPAIGLDALKGLGGKAELTYRQGSSNHKVDLTDWALRGEKGGETKGWHLSDFDDSSWDEKTVPINLNKGEILWYRASFNTSDLPDMENYLAPVSLKLIGKNAKATIFLNGRLIARWISNDNWLERGSWTRSVRKMWSDTDPDIFPVSSGILKTDGTPNTLSIMFEDVSGGKSNETEDFKAGTIEELSIILNREEKIGEGRRSVIKIKGSF